MSRFVLGAAFVCGVLAPRASAGDLVNSGFESGQAWNGSSYVKSAGWPDAFRGGYALNPKNSLEFKRWPVSGSMSETALSIRFQFRVVSDTLATDPNHDGAPFEQITLLGITPKNGKGKRPNVALKRDDNFLILRIEDYGDFRMARDAIVVPGRWHTLDVALDQGNNDFKVALDGVVVHDDPDASLGSGTPFTTVELGIVYSQKNGHDIWFDNVRIADSGSLLGPEVDATATVTPGVGVVPLTASFALNTSASNPTIEWDLDGNGTIDATGASVTKKYSSTGTYAPVARVTTSSGRTAAYPPVVHVFGSSAPTVNLSVENGGSTSQPYPRVYDFRADISPTSGAKITKVEFDWTGAGVNPWHGRSLWKHAGPIVVRLPHEFPFDTPAATVRVRAWDDGGRVGSGELNLTLPTAPGDPTPAARDARSGIYVTYGWPEVYAKRGNKLPNWVTGADIGAYLEWSAIETASGSFDFGPVNGSDPYTYNGRLNQIAKSGKNVILHHRAYFPSWLFSKVGKSNKKNPEGNHYPQFWDPRYLPYVERFADEQAANLEAILAANPGWVDRFVLTRGQWLAIDSELLPSGAQPVVAFAGSSSSMALTAANFTAPTSGAYNVDFSPELAAIYAANVRAAYRDAFDAHGIPVVFKPHAGGWYNGSDSVRSDEEFRRSIANRGEGLFVTSSRAETSHDHWFLDYTDRGHAEGFHEYEGNNNSIPSDTAQWQYWTLLSQLNCGSEFVGTQGDFAWLLEYVPSHDNEPIHDFVNRHVGWKPHPATAPSAWIALKPLTRPPNENFETGNYGALLVEKPDDGIDVTNVGSVKYTYTGPTNLGHPATLNEPMQYARKCPAGKRLHFDVDDAFRAAHGNGFDLEIVYHDTYQGVFFIRCNNLRGQLKYFFVPMTGDGKWHRAVVPMNSVQLSNDLGAGIDFAIEADAQDTTFHRLVLTPQ